VFGCGSGSEVDDNLAMSIQGGLMKVWRVAGVALLAAVGSLGGVSDAVAATPTCYVAVSNPAIIDWFVEARSAVTCSPSVRNVRVQTKLFWDGPTTDYREVDRENVTYSSPTPMKRQKVTASPYFGNYIATAQVWFTYRGTPYSKSDASVTVVIS
jgi:hypothetical protein